ncbi:probable serine/threonine-protein kinase drkD [Spodoptera litura]|uniref:Probable serine/threonine-protein kinase drkD n=1 Tax=Spodoptera litura TaxID=69820 RepID=A0A9J7IX29_SPOLT|nr:probable serine/threonine-protein kinase drkD [Spodoptera litura]
MFYDKNLMNDKILGIVWKLANNISTENIGNQNLTTICTELDSWVNIAVLPHRRLSLRTSSTLVNGTAMLYQRNMHQLLDDVIKLDEDIVQRRRRKYFSSSSPSANESSTSTATPEEMRRQPVADFDFDSSFSPTKRAKLDQISPHKNTPSLTVSRSSSDNFTIDETTNNSNEQNSKDKECNNNENCDSENDIVVADLTGENVGDNSTINEIIENQRIDKEVQTSPTHKHADSSLWKHVSKPHRADREKNMASPNVGLLPLRFDPAIC